MEPFSPSRFKFSQLSPNLKLYANRAARSCFRSSFIRKMVLFILGLNLILYLMPSKLHVDFTISKPDLDDIPVARTIFASTTYSKISKIVHLTWKDRVLPNATVKWVKRWADIAPDWEYWFWTDEDGRKLVETKFPDYLAMYDAYPKSIYRADAVRYFILFEYGGVYADLDVEPLRPLEPILDQYTCILSQEPKEHAKLLNDVFSDDNKELACNAFMASRPRHPFFYSVIDNLAKNHAISELFYHVAGRTILSTGPGMLTKMYTLYTRHAKRHIALYPEDAVYMAPSRYFTPIFDPEKMELVKLKCSRRYFHLMPDFKKKVCYELMNRSWVNVPSNESYTNHHWFHSWLAGNEGKEARQEGFTNRSLTDILPRMRKAKDLKEFERSALCMGGVLC